MKKLLENKAVILFLAAAGLASLILLAAGLRNMQFQPAQPLGINLGSTPTGVMAGTILDMPMWFYMLMAAVMLLVLFVSFLVMDPKMRRQVSRGMFRFLISMAVLAWVMQNAAKNRKDAGLSNLPLASAGSSLAGSGSSGPVYAPPVISPWLILGVSFLIAALLLLAGWLIYKRWSKKKPYHPLVEIAGIARKTIDDLADGGNWDNAIVQCYVRMSQVVTAQRGLIRQIGTTPSEFAARMERAGLPGEAVRVLTRLFEQARYGGATSSVEDRNLAVSALNAILYACGETP